MNHETTFTTLTEVLLARAHSAQTVTFIEGQGQRYSVPYGELHDRALHQLAVFQRHGLRPGSQLIIQVANNARFLEAFWACLLGGIVAVPVSGGNSSEHRRKLFRIIDKLAEPGLFVDKSTQVRLADFAPENQLLQIWDSVKGKVVLADEDDLESRPGRVHIPNVDDVAFIQFSSGSTSTPKGVVLTHKNLMTNTRSIMLGCQISQQDRMLSWMPLTHDMGLIGFHLTPVVNDICHYLMPTDLFVRRPGLWLTESAEHNITILCSPNFGYQHLLKTFKPEKFVDLDLSSVRLLFNGAEPISVQLCERFMQTLAPFKLSSDAMYPVYGLAEASLAVSFPALDNRFSTITVSRSSLGVGQHIQSVAVEDDSAVSFVAVGSAVPDVQVQISDADGLALPDETIGHICIRGDNVTRGYYQEPELNQQLISEDGWLNTGDLGFLGNKQLFITGRAKDIIFVSGQNVYPHDLEEIIVQAGLLERGKLAVSSQASQDHAEEALLVFVLHRSDPTALEETARSITRLLSEAAGVRVHAVVPVNRIPKTTSGKVQRYLLVEALDQGEFTPLLQSQTETGADDTDGSADYSNNATSNNALSIKDRLLMICNTAVVDMSVSAEDNLFELGISSLTLAQIHASIEDIWPDQVDITDLFDYPTVLELSQFLETKA